MVEGLEWSAQVGRKPYRIVQVVEVLFHILCRIQLGWRFRSFPLSCLSIAKESKSTLHRIHR
jgi:hypothetical protein